MASPEIHPRRIFLADDDDDDRLLFVDALKELPTAAELTIARNGEHLMAMLKEIGQKPDVLFLDLNMPLKNGFECLEEIKSTEGLKQVPVIIFSTASQPSAINQLYEQGAQLYVCKPTDFTNLKKLINHVLSVNWKEVEQPPKDQFVLSL
jgi:CheY-like chemotaxis protein